MALSKEKKQAIMDNQKGSKIMSDNAKIQMDELEGRELTITDYDKVGSDAEGKHHYFAVKFEELPGFYVLSGSALTKIIDDGDDPESGSDLRGEKVRVDKKVKLDGGRTYTPVILL